ncbi:MAG: twin-arginine translocation pathway signal protein [Nitrosomonadales bacterium]|nr:twin-arginine translocation pathway signal protein [Nitrosomonadales bacterium]
MGASMTKLARRKFIQWMAASTGLLLAACHRDKPIRAAELPKGCVARPEQTEGPFYFDTQLERADIRSEPATGETKEGIPFVLNIQVSALDGLACVPLADAIVDIWHCDANGIYSSVKPDRMQSADTADLKFLRGYQKTNSNGDVSFLTIFPGWYDGRTAHIHFKIRTTLPDQSTYEFTSQIYFEDTFSQRMYTNGVYIRDRAQRVTNRNDDIFIQDGGDQLMVHPVLSDNLYIAHFDITLDFADKQVGKPDGFFMQRRG